MINGRLLVFFGWGCVIYLSYIMFPWARPPLFGFVTGYLLADKYYKGKEKDETCLS